MRSFRSRFKECGTGAGNSLESMRCVKAIELRLGQKSGSIGQSYYRLVRRAGYTSINS